MRRNYVEMKKLLVRIGFFEDFKNRGLFNSSEFKGYLIGKGVLDEFNKCYRSVKYRIYDINGKFMEYNERLDYDIWDFSNRFRSFMECLDEIDSSNRGYYCIK